MVGPLSYIGGKNRLAKTIIAMMPEHTTYVEPFAGGAQVFFHKEPSEVEVLNDLNDEIVNFFKVCQLHQEELIRYAEGFAVSRNWYKTLLQTPLNTLTDVQRAARFLYLQKNSFGGRVVRQNYAAHVLQKPAFKPKLIEGLIRETHSRLQDVQLESLPYEEILRRYDRSSTLFYLDPPYWNKQLYRFNLKEEDFVKMKEELKKLKGKFILSLNDVQEVRDLFAKFCISTVELAYTAQSQAGRRYKEVLITNFRQS